MTLFDMPNYLWITTLIMILLTIFCCLVLNKWFVSAVITFVILGVLAFFKSSPDSCVKCYTMFLPFLLIKIDVFS
ncbi:hypothetical protein M6K066_0995 [Staphylococcus aureus]|nr:hypothetical protein M6K066_0995 [Staphylococcus aureus]